MPAPLPAAADVLVGPNPAILSVQAEKIDRPFLTPQPIDFGQPLTPNGVAIIGRQPSGSLCVGRPLDAMSRIGWDNSLTHRKGRDAPEQTGRARRCPWAALRH